MARVQTGGFSALLAEGLWRVLFNTLNRQPNQWVGVFHTHTMHKAYEEDAKVAGLGAMVPKPEGDPISFDVPIMGPGVRYTPASYGLGFRITREMWDDDLYHIMDKMAAELGRAASYKIEVDAWSLLNNAFNPAYAGADGLPLVHSAHTRLDGGQTMGNRPAVDVDFSATAYQAALDHFKSLVDERGRPVVMNPSLLIIDPSFEWAAREILESEYKPYTANNEVNVLRSDGKMDYLLSRYLTDSDSWFVLSDEHDLNFFWRVKPETGEADDFLTGDALYKIYSRYAKGFTEWRGVYGSSGG
jgi:hypothetical protein